MSNPEIPLFDVLCSQKHPFDGFGPLEDDSQKVDRLFLEVVGQARSRVTQTFGIAEVSGAKLTTKLDDVVAEMWSEGWDPRSGDTNLFTRDFGALLMDSLLREASGQAVFRSTSDLSNASVFWPIRKIEVFPFHKVLKCFINREGESLSQFYRGVVKLVSESHQGLGPQDG